MSKRLQIVIPDEEYEALRDLAGRRGLTLAAWAREALRAVSREEPSGGADRKLAVVRAAVKHAFPSGDIDAMLGEIEAGYLGEPAS